MFDYVLYCHLFGIGRVEFLATATSGFLATMEFREYLAEIYPDNWIDFDQPFECDLEGPSEYPLLF